MRYATYPAAVLCRLLEVSRSGYYAWRARPERQDRLAPQVGEVFWRHSRRYGSRRITAELRDQAVIGRHRVRRLMREQGLQAIQPRRFVPRTTDSRHGQRMSPNLLLKREVKVDRPHRSRAFQHRIHVVRLGGARAEERTDDDERRQEG